MSDRRDSVALDHPKDGDAAQDDRQHVDDELGGGSLHAVPVSVDRRHADIGGCRDGGHRDQDADEDGLTWLRPGRASPTTPARTATIDGIPIWIGDEEGQRVVLGKQERWERSRSSAARAVRAAADRIPSGNPMRIAFSDLPACRRRPSTTATLMPARGPVLGPDHHGADEQDDRVGEDPDRAHHRCDRPSGPGRRWREWNCPVPDASTSSQTTASAGEPSAASSASRAALR